MIEGDVISVLELDDTFEKLEICIKEPSYLCSLSEKVLFERYREALKVNHYLPFDDFSKPLE